MADIFLSYNRDDQPVARRFAEALERDGLSVWWDTALRSGENYDIITEKALRDASAVVVLWSPKSVVSRWVRSEATIADRNGTLVPVMIAPCERPIMFELTQTADLCGWNGDGTDDVWLSFVRDVRAMIGRRRPQSAPLDATPPLGISGPAAGTRGPDHRGNAPSLAVLPFRNRSGLSEDDVFALGMVEDLIEALSQAVNLRVLSSSATARFCAGGAPDFVAMGRDLDLRYVMEGNVRRAGQDLRVTAQLIEASSGAILWAQKFERALPELAALQEDLVVELAAHLDSQVRRAEMERLLRKPTDLTAWECVTRAVAAYRQITPESLVRAITEARRAVDLAPDYGLAHAMLADAQATAYLWTSPDDAQAVAGIRSHIDRALALDAESAIVLAHVAQAFNYVGQPEEALQPALRAIQLSPNLGLAHYSLGVACLLLDRNAEALAHLDAQISAEPGSHILFASYIWRGAAHVRMRSWEAAYDDYCRALRINPAATSAYLGAAFTAAALGRTEEGRALTAKIRQLEPGMACSDWERILSRGLNRSAVRDEVIELVRSLWPVAALAG